MMIINPIGDILIEVVSVIAIYENMISKISQIN